MADKREDGEEAREHVFATASKVARALIKLGGVEGAQSGLDAFLKDIKAERKSKRKQSKPSAQASKGDEAKGEGRKLRASSKGEARKHDRSQDEGTSGESEEQPKTQETSQPNGDTTSSKKRQTKKHKNKKKAKAEDEQRQRHDEDDDAVKGKQSKKKKKERKEKESSSKVKGHRRTSKEAASQSGDASSEQVTKKIKMMQGGSQSQEGDAGYWQTANLGSDERKSKFLRLMGAGKKKQASAAASRDVDVNKGARINQALEQQFERARHLRKAQGGRAGFAA